MPFHLPSTASIAFAALAAAAGIPPAIGPRRVNGAEPGHRPAPFKARYAGELAGTPAFVAAAFETHQEQGVFSGEISTGAHAYVFSAEIFGNGGFGNLVDKRTGERVRIHVAELSARSFVMTTNPAPGLPQSTHCFEGHPES